MNDLPGGGSRSGGSPPRRGGEPAPWLRNALTEPQTTSSDPAPARQSRARPAPPTRPESARDPAARETESDAPAASPEALAAGSREDAAATSPKDAADPTRSDAAEWVPSFDLIPLLPRGRPLFDSIPARAVLLDEMAPAVEHGAMIVRESGTVGVVLVNDGELSEKYCFTAGERMEGATALRRLSHLGEGATISAYVLDPEIVAMAPALLRGEILYDDLRLGWTSWHDLITDLSSRGQAYVVEVTSPQGRGVICLNEGRCLAAYTDSHPEMGAATLLDALVQSPLGAIRVRQQPTAEQADTGDELAAPAAPMAEPQIPEPLTAPIATVPAAPSVTPPSVTPPMAAVVSPPPVTPPPTVMSSRTEATRPDVVPPTPEEQWIATQEAPASDTPGTEWTDEQVWSEDDHAGLAADGPPPPPVPGLQPSDFAGIFGSSGSSSAPPPPAPGFESAAPPAADRSVRDLLPELKMVARNRLQRSAARVEAMLDDAAEADRPIAAVLDEVAGLTIRGVMQSTLDQVVDDMRNLAEGKPS